MGNAAFLSLVFGGILFILLVSTTAVFQRPQKTSVAGVMTVLDLVEGWAGFSKTGSHWWMLAVVALAGISYFVLQHAVRYLLRRGSTS